MSESKLTALFWVRDSYLPTIKAPPLHKAVLLLAASYANPDGSSIFQSSRGVAALLGCERSTVQSAFKFWREKGVLALVQAGNGRSHANEFRINLNIDLETNGVLETPLFRNGVLETPFQEGNGVIEADKRGGKRGDKRGAGNPPPNHRSHRKETGEERGTPAEPSLSCFTGQHLNVAQRQDALLGAAFPWIDRQNEYRKIDSWLEANPERRPKKASRFLHNWFQRCKPNEGGRNGHPTESFAERNIRRADEELGEVSRRAQQALQKVGEGLPKPTNRPGDGTRLLGSPGGSEP